MTTPIIPLTPTPAEAVPIITVLAVFVAMFLSVRHRASSERVRLWAYAWSLVFLHFTLRTLGYRAESLLRFTLAADYATLQLAGLIFLTSFLFRSNDAKKRRTLLLLAGVPMVVHCFAMYSLERDLWLRAVSFAVLFLGPAAFWWKASGKQTLLVGAGVGALGAIGLLGAWQLFRGDQNLSMGIILTLAYGLCGPLFWRLYRRRSAGVLIVTAGFATWAAQFPMVAVMALRDPRHLALLTLWNVPRVLVALGMVLTVMEDNLGLIRQAKARAQAENRLLDRLSQLKSRLLAGNDALTLCGEVAFAVTEASDFSRAALLLVGDDAKLRLVSASGFTPECLRELRQRAGEDTAGAFRHLSTQAPMIGNVSFVLCERESLILIPLVSGRGSAVGCLGVARPKSPDGPDPAQVLRLEVFASDLAVTIENMRLRQQLVRSEKLAAIGQLVAGVAHELNNPLTGILGYADLLAAEIREPRWAQRLEKLSGEAQRMKRILDGLLRFGRQNGSAPRAARLHDTLRDVLLFRDYQLHAHGIQVNVHMDHSLPNVGLGEDELKQVLLNILNNAMDAVQESTRRTIRVRGFEKDGRIVIQCDDSGPGFADLNRAFDPFYTTKPVGKGTGLGLSVCYGIVREADGEIALENLQPKGARVTVELPVAAAQPVVVVQA